MGLYDIWKEFFENLPKITTAVEPYAKRCGLTNRQALLLILLSDYKDFDLSFFNDDIMLLSKLGYITENNGKISITGKGAIFTKSLKSKL